MAVMIVGGLCGLHAQAEVSGPYRVISFNHTDRSIYSYQIDGFGAGGAYANESQGGSSIVCCLDVPPGKKTWHIRIVYDLTREEAQRNQPDEVYETDVPIPALPDKHRGYVAFHFLPDRKIVSQWVARRIDAHVPDTR